jgi:hypothetical protein
MGREEERNQITGIASIIALRFINVRLGVTVMLAYGKTNR